MGKQKKQKIVRPPDLPPEITEEEIEVSDEDRQFVNEHRDYAGFFDTRLDTQSITKHVTRVANAKEDALESSYEKRPKKKSAQEEKEENGIQVERTDALPIKTLDGKIYYRTVPQTSTTSENGNDDVAGDAEDEEAVADRGIMKLTKAERRAKLKKSKKEAKKHGKDEAKSEEVQETPQAVVLAEVKEDLSAEETLESKKCKLAELGIALLADPEANIKYLKEMLQISKDDHTIVKLGLLSLLAVFKDIIPGSRIRLPTEKELEMNVSKAIKKMRYYESTLLSAYQAYLKKLIALERQPLYQHVAVRCVCTLLDAVPHFNYREGLIGAVVRNLNSSDESIRKLCATTLKSLFTNEGKHGGEATLEAVKLIAFEVKAHDCQLHPSSIEVFMSLSFDEDLGRAEKREDNSKFKSKKSKKRKYFEEKKQLRENDRKKSKQELAKKLQDEVAADYKAASFTPDVAERRSMQTETLSAVFETYFRILKRTTRSFAVRAEESAAGLSDAHPLLSPCLDGLGKFSHLLDVDYMGDLMNHLSKLSSGSYDSKSVNCLKNLTVSERLRCCIVAFKVMRNNLDALNVDLQEFFVQLYNLVLEYRPGRDQGDVLAEALKIMLCEDRQRDMQKTAAFVKRLATFALCFGSAEAMAALVTLKHLLLKNVKCRNLLENDAGGGSVSGSVAKFQPFASDPNLSGALASVLWELNLLSKHYHSAVSTIASGISSMGSSQNQVPNQVSFTTHSPQQALQQFSIEQESFTLKGDIRKFKSKGKRGSDSSISATSPILDNPINEDAVKTKLSEHFMLLHDFKENERLRGELDRTTLALQLHEEYAKQKKRKTRRSKASP